MHIPNVLIFVKYMWLKFDINRNGKNPNLIGPFSRLYVDLKETSLRYLIRHSILHEDEKSGCSILLVKNS